MGFYDVVKPCVVGKLHYARPTAQPIEVDDAVAEPLVEDGSLQPYEPGGISGKTGTKLDGVIRQVVSELPAELVAPTIDASEAPAESPKPRRGRRTGA